MKMNSLYLTLIRENNSLRRLVKHLLALVLALAGVIVVLTFWIIAR